MAHLIISAAHKSSGKTTVSIGLCAALSRTSALVQPFKKGPDYIDPLWLGQASGRPCYNLDFFTMGSKEITQLFHDKMQDADIGIIEGNKGLYDGLDLHGSNSNAALANLLEAPVVLVLDTRGMTRGIAPLILGYQAFDSNIHIAGVVLNSVGGSRHETKLRNVIEHYTDVRVVGAVPRNDDVQIDERHLGLMPSNEALAAQQRIDKIADHVGSHVDMDAILAIASSAGNAKETHLSAINTIADTSDRVRIAYAKDAAFGFYYPDDLDALQVAGAELIPFDTLNDPALPEVDGLFIGGGFPETAMRPLEKNKGMRASIKTLIDEGGPAYAECGGLMYLCQSLQWNGVTAEMVGVIPANAKMHQKPQGRGYVRLCETSAHPWQDEVDLRSVNAHEFHYSGLENLDPMIEFAYTVERGFGVDGVHDGLVYNNLLANYSHMRNVGTNHWAERFVAHIRKCQFQTQQRK